MSTELYAFSGTGNSLAVARQIADIIEAQLMSIPSAVRSESVISEADTVGLVFPVYHKSIPLIIKRFVERLEVEDSAYIFAVCTYGDTPGLAIDHLRELIASRSRTLAAGFGVHMPYNYLTPSPVVRGFFRSFTLREVPVERQEDLLARAPEGVAGIVASIHARESGTFDTTSDVLTRLAQRLGLPETLGKWVWLKVAGVEEPTDLSFLESRQLMDRPFEADESCNGCGICARVCPVANIELVEAPSGGHAEPSWQGRCEQCFACLQWCPQEAIQFGSATAGRKRYHHPDVSVADMVRLASGNQSSNG